MVDDSDADPVDDPESEEPDSALKPEPTIECRMCHAVVRETQTVYMGGRRLCYGCAEAWFEEE
jgi:formylmethanofuran dehydrogenase subunit E